MKKTALFLIIIMVLSTLLPRGAITAAAAGNSAAASGKTPSTAFFSDLESGPNTGGQDNKGLFVTIWGSGFGSARGSSYVTVGGGKVDNYPVWTDSRITFQLGAKVASGDIRVVTADGASNAIPFKIRSGGIFFVKAGGSDAKGDGSWSRPWATIIHAKNSIRPGDTIYACQGTDATEVDTDKECLALNTSGEADRYKALVAYPNASVTIGSLSVKRAIQTMLPDSTGSSYWVVSQFNLTGREMAFNARDNSAGLRLVGNRITCPIVGDVPMAAVAGIADHFYILGNVFYNNGDYPGTSRLYHNIYIGNHLKREVKDIEIGWNIIRDSMACRAIQSHTEGNDAGAVSDVRIHDNRISNIRSNGIYIGYLSTGSWKIYNNLLSYCGMGPAWGGADADYGGITIRDNSADIQLYNNIIYNSGYSSKLENAHDAWYSSAGLSLQNYTGKLSMNSNIISQNTPEGSKHYPYVAIDSKSTIPAAGALNNIFFGSGPAPVWDTSASNADPRFTNPSKGDFTLAMGSPATPLGFKPLSLLAETPLKVAAVIKKLINGKTYLSDTDMAATLSLGSGNKGKVTMEFDVTPIVDNTYALIAYSNAAAVPNFGNFSIMLQLNEKGYFAARNGAMFTAMANVPYTADSKYHVRITTDTVKGKYSVFVKPNGRPEVQIARDFAYNAGCPLPADIGKISLISPDSDGIISVEKHKTSKAG